MEKALKNLIGKAMLTVAVGLSAVAAGAQPLAPAPETYGGILKGFWNREPAELAKGGNLSAVSSSPQKKSVRRAQLATTSDGTEIWGLLMSSDEWSNAYSAPYGVYQFNTSDFSTKTLLGNVGYCNGGGSFSNNTLRYTAWGLEASMVAYYYEYDIDTWETVEEPRTMDGHMISVCSAFDPTTYKTYGVYYGEDFNAAEWNFGIIDYVKEKTTKLSSMTNICLAMICDNDGQLYGITADGMLNKIDKQTGAFTKIGSTGVSIKQVMQSAVFDRQNEKMYWAAMTSDNQALLYEVNIQTAAVTLVAEFPNHEEPVAMFIPLTYSDDAPAAVTGVKLTFKNANTWGAVQFTAPTTTISGQKLTGDLTYTVKVNGKVIGSGEAEVGEEDVTIAAKDIEEGVNTFEIYVSNAAGNGKSVYEKRYIGRDTPKAPQNVKFTLDKSNNNLATVTWDFPLSGGVNGGYADPADFTYKVIRMPDSIVVSEGKKDRVFTENLEKKQWQTYSYKVFSVNNGLESSAARTSGIAFGNALDLPYFNDFNTRDKFNEFETVSLNGRGWTWSYIGVNKGNAHCYLYDCPTSSEWLISPPLKMRAGYEYSLDYLIFGNGSWKNQKYGGKMAVYLGTDADTTNLKKNELSPMEWFGGEDDWEERDIRFKVDADGEYRVAFQGTYFQEGDYITHYLHLDSLTVSEAKCYAAPDSVKNLKVISVSGSVPQATIEFDAPSVTGAGDALTTITSIDIYRDDELIKTITEAAPGSHQTYTDTDPANGFNTYSVVASNAAGRGIPVERTVYAGIDIPVAPENVLLSDNLNGSFTISWDNVVMGQNGMYIPDDGVTFNVYSVLNGSYQLLKGDIQGTSYVINGISQTGAQSRVYYAVSATTEAGTSDYTTSNQLYTGAPYVLPYYESFSNEQQSSGPWTVSKKGSGQLGLLYSSSYDNDYGCIVIYPGSTNFEGILTSPKVSLSSARHPVGSFYYYCEPGKDMSLKVQVICDGKRDTIDVKTIDIINETGTAAYKQAVIDLDAYKSSKYINVIFHFIAHEAGFYMLLDNIKLHDMKDYDLGITLDKPVSVRAGSQNTATATVTNAGGSTASGYKVLLYQNGKIVASEDGKEILSGQTQDYDLPFKASNTDLSEITLMAEVSYDKDEVTDNNVSNERTVFVYSPTYPTVTDLAADGDNSLKWSAVNTDDLKVTDGFENYYPLERYNIGDWTTLDADKGEPYEFTLSYVEQFRKPFAYVVNNPNAIGFDLEEDPAWGPHGGEQYLMAFAVQGSTTALGHNDDWLISPLLSGKSQTVSAWMKSYNSTFGLEDYSILYSTTDKDTVNFKNIVTGQAPLEWTEVTAQLPDGAKYFAIRHTGVEKYIFMLDDVTYMPGGMTVKGYNVYRDGELIGTVGADQNSFTDSADDGKSHTYNVTVIYEVGESGPSNSVSLTSTGIMNLQTNTYAVGHKGFIEVGSETEQPVSIYSSGGIKMYGGNVQATTRIPLQAGLYIVKVSDKTYNLTVK